VGIAFQNCMMSTRELQLLFHNCNIEDDQESAVLEVIDV
jgi:hypothetical protein